MRARAGVEQGRGQEERDTESDERAEMREADGPELARQNTVGFGDITIVLSINNDGQLWSMVTTS